MFTCMSSESVGKFDMYIDCVLIHDIGPYKIGQELKMICHDKILNTLILYRDGSDPIEINC